MSQKESEWVKEFDKKFLHFGSLPCEFGQSCLVEPTEIKDFIKAVLFKREKEIAEEVKKMKIFPPEIFDRKDLSGKREKGFNEAINSVLQLLKH